MQTERQTGPLPVKKVSSQTYLVQNGEMFSRPRETFYSQPSGGERPKTEQIKVQYKNGAGNWQKTRNIENERSISPSNLSNLQNKETNFSSRPQPIERASSKGSLHQERKVVSIKRYMTINGEKKEISEQEWEKMLSGKGQETSLTTRFSSGSSEVNPNSNKKETMTNQEIDVNPYLKTLKEINEKVNIYMGCVERRLSLGSSQKSSFSRSQSPLREIQGGYTSQTKRKNNNLTSASEVSPPQSPLKHSTLPFPMPSPSLDWTGPAGVECLDVRGDPSFPIHLLKSEKERQTERSSGKTPSKRYRENQERPGMNYIEELKVYTSDEELSPRHRTSLNRLRSSFKPSKSPTSPRSPRERPICIRYWDSLTGPKARYFPCANSERGIEKIKDRLEDWEETDLPERERPPWNGSPRLGTGYVGRDRAASRRALEDYAQRQFQRYLQRTKQ